MLSYSLVLTASRCPPKINKICYYRFKLLVWFPVWFYLNTKCLCGSKGTCTHLFQRTIMLSNPHRDSFTLLVTYCTISEAAAVIPIDRASYIHLDWFHITTQVLNYQLVLTWMWRFPREPVSTTQSFLEDVHTSTSSKVLSILRWHLKHTPL